MTVQGPVGRRQLSTSANIAPKAPLTPLTTREAWSPPRKHTFRTVVPAQRISPNIACHVPTEDTLRPPRYKRKKKEMMRGLSSSASSPSFLNPFSCTLPPRGKTKRNSEYSIPFLSSIFLPSYFFEKASSYLSIGEGTLATMPAPLSNEFPLISVQPSSIGEQRTETAEPSVPTDLDQKTLQ